MKISVIIPTYNRRALIALTLPSVLEQTLPFAEREVIVVIDGSSDGTAAELRKIHSPCPLTIIERANAGAAAARNAGVQVSSGEHLLFLDDDILCDEDLLSTHLAAQLGKDRTLIHGQIVVSPEGKRTLADDASQLNAQNFYRSLSDSGISLPKDAHVLCNSSLPRTLLNECGWFDESIPFQRDDCEFGVRLWKMGVTFQFCPDAKSYEVSSKPSSVYGKRDAMNCGRGEVLLCRKHPEFRPSSALSNLRSGKLRSKIARRVCLAVPALPDIALAASVWIAERFRTVPFVQRVGIKLLGIRRRLSFLRGAIAEEGSWRALTHSFAQQLPVLLYHNIDHLDSTTTYPGMTILPEQFEKQVRWLSRNGYNGISASDWISWCKSGRELPAKPVLLTFDDAYQGVSRYALPILSRFGFSATVYVVGRQIGGTNAWEKEKGGIGSDALMTALEITAWSKRGIEFGAHSLTHPDLTRLNQRELYEEMNESAKELSCILGTNVTSFAYPYGYYNEDVRNAAANEFVLACTCEEGLNNLQTDLCLIRRTSVRTSDTLVDLACRVNFGWSPLSRLRWHLRLGTRLRAMKSAFSGA